MAIGEGGVGVYKERQLNAEQAYQQALASLAAEQRNTFNQYGFEGDVDANTGAITTSINPNLQFGLIQQMLRGHNSGIKNIIENNSSRGLGTTGLAKQRQNLLRFLQQGDVASIGQRFRGAIGNIQNQRGNARRMRDNEFSAAEEAQAYWMMQQGLLGSTAAGTPPGPNTPNGVDGPIPGVGYSAPGIPGGTSRWNTQDEQNYDPAAAQLEIAKAMAAASSPQSYDPYANQRPRGRQFG